MQFCHVILTNFAMNIEHLKKYCPNNFDKTSLIRQVFKRYYFSMFKSLMKTMYQHIIHYVNNFSGTKLALPMVVDIAIAVIPRRGPEMPTVQFTSRARLLVRWIPTI